MNQKNVNEKYLYLYNVHDSNNSILQKNYYFDNQLMELLNFIRSKTITKSKSN